MAKIIKGFKMFPTGSGDGSYVHGLSKKIKSEDDVIQLMNELSIEYCKHKIKKKLLIMVEQMMEMKTGWTCVECGSRATEGSMKHPYCKECFKRVWNNDYDRYNSFLYAHN